MMIGDGFALIERSQPILFTRTTPDYSTIYPLINGAPYGVIEADLAFHTTIAGSHKLIWT